MPRPVRQNKTKTRAHSAPVRMPKRAMRTIARTKTVASARHTTQQRAVQDHTMVSAQQQRTIMTSNTSARLDNIMKSRQQNMILPNMKASVLHTLYKRLVSNDINDRNAVTDRVVTILNQFDKVQGKTVTPQSTFKDLGLDSLDRVEVVLAIEESFGVEFTDEQSDRFQSLPEVIDYLTQRPDAKQQTHRWDPSKSV